MRSLILNLSTVEAFEAYGNEAKRFGRMSCSWSTPEAAANAVTPLATSLTQYPVLEMLVSHLKPDDLVTLTTTCQAIQQQFRMGHAKVKKSLLRKTLCPGMGIEIRRSIHCPCKTPGWHEYSGCSGEGYDVASKPCIECGINTCDECRIHVTYQVFMDDSGFDNRRWWAGYLMLIPSVFGLHPPEGTEGSSWHLPPDMMASRHDQGRLHVPAHVLALADPEPLDRILDTNLGRHSLTPWGRTDEPYNGENVIDPFMSIAIRRKVFVCQPCYQEHHERKEVAPCSCTFRKRFLDRWMCIPCHVKEVHRIERNSTDQLELDENKIYYESFSCLCGSKLSLHGDRESICAWCDGCINIHDHEDTNEEIDRDFKNNDDDDSNAGPVPEDATPGALTPVDNKDGTMAVYYDGTRISGERIGRNMVQLRAIQKGIKLPCSCCDCPALRCAYRDHDHDQDHDSHVDADGNESSMGSNEDDDEGRCDGLGDVMPGMIEFDEDKEPDELEEVEEE
ncbi:hypothetical protein HBI29_095270 [Parastagonospora nodorum]|nr:hypothetical protein HBI29_095270 [Parastagonospora nodorum]KAH5654303.1 hypothetical protein HBI51_055390 [Parastagonospora nodorum]KAH6303091.1 hypothetical protein HBI39_120000 [Parastagonospora nodorum]KAH6387335.1 hypothetical protein HBI60_209770 [Parastagonospora nodorum]KAH6447025.1 hypothetical protein HBI57_217960 [Parastagonospora nodorum]